MTVLFTQPVTGFTAFGLTVVGGVINAFTAVDASTYTLQVSVSVPYAVVTVDVAPGVAFNAQNRGNLRAVQLKRVHGMCCDR